MLSLVMRSVMILAPPSISTFSLRAHGSVSTKSSPPTRPRVPVCVLLRMAADGVGAERAALVLGRVLAVGGISADDVARLAVRHEIDALIVDEQDSRGRNRLGRVRHVLEDLLALLRRGDRMLDDPADVLGLEPQHWHHLLRFSCGQMCSAATLRWDQSPLAI